MDATITKLIEDNLPSKNKEKTELGEVFTPIHLISNIYAHFPPTILKDSTLSWIDPACGIGNFTLVLFFKLMETLRTKIPNDIKRATHIIEKMLFMVEINAANVAICKKLFKKICPTAVPNIHCGNFLHLDTNRLGWPEKFDCIVGNPPYNIGGTARDGTKRTHVVFTEHGLKHITDTGFIAYICPPSYRETDSTMNKLFRGANGHFVYIKIYGPNETYSLFRVQGRVDAFIYQKSKKGSTIVNDEYNIISKSDIDLSRHIPNFGLSIFDKLHDKVASLGKVSAFRNTEMSSVKKDVCVKGNNKVLHLIIEKGRRIFKTAKKHSMTDTPKLLVNGLGLPYAYYDKGEYGPSQTPVIVLKPSANLVNFVKSDFFPFIAWGLRLTGNNNLPYLFDYIPDVSKEKNSYKTMEQFKTGLKLTEKEMKFITEHFHAYKYTDADVIEPCKKKTLKTLKTFQK